MAILALEDCSSNGMRIVNILHCVLPNARVKELQNEKKDKTIKSVLRAFQSCPVTSLSIRDQNLVILSLF